MVPTSTGQPREMGLHFPVGERSGYFEHTGNFSQFLFIFSDF